MPACEVGKQREPEPGIQNPESPAIKIPKRGHSLKARACFVAPATNTDKPIGFLAWAKCLRRDARRV